MGSSCLWPTQLVEWGIGDAQTGRWDSQKRGQSKRVPESPKDRDPSALGPQWPPPTLCWASGLVSMSPMAAFSGVQRSLLCGQPCFFLVLPSA